MKSKHSLTPRGIKLPNRTITIKEIVFTVVLIFCFTPLASPPVALLLGLVVAQTTGNPFLYLNHKITRWLLQFLVVGLGFGMNAITAVKAGKEGVLVTVISITGTLVLGYALGRMFKTDKKTSFLISSGTAICGGSAIAAISSVIKAEEHQISVALGTIFILNSAALILFPFVGAQLHLSQEQFGLWCAIAIHDTSSVVGAAGKYGSHALEIATTVKLIRALWIIPLAFFSAMLFRSKGVKIKIPYFIGWFVVAIVLNTYLPFVHYISATIVSVSKAGLTVTLFLIGSGLSKKIVSAVGFRPILQGILLWISISVPALLAILYL